MKATEEQIIAAYNEALAIRSEHLKKIKERDDLRKQIEEIHNKMIELDKSIIYVDVSLNSIYDLINKEDEI